MTWTVTNNGQTLDFDGWNISSPVLNTANLALDTFSFSIIKEGDPAIPFQSRGLTLSKDGTAIFRGRFRDWSDQVSGDDEAFNLAADGPWLYFENLIYKQRWATSQTGIIDGEYLANVVLGTGPDGLPASLESCIEDVLDYAIDAGAPISKGDYSAYGEEAPVISVSGISCAEAIRRLLSWRPYTVGTWDYSACHPRFNLTPRESLCVKDLVLGDNGPAGYDLRSTSARPVGVDLQYIRAVDSSGSTVSANDLNSTGQEQLRAVVVDSYPPPEQTGPFGRLAVTIDLSEDPTAPAPSGLAQRYFESLPCRVVTGTINNVDEEITGPWVGRAAKILNGRPDWQVPTVVQSASYQIATGSSSLSVGLPTHLTAEDFVSQQRQLKKVIGL